MLVAAAIGFAADRSSGATGPGAVVRLSDLQTKYDDFGNGEAPGSGEIARFTLFGSNAHPIGHGVLVCTYVGGGERTCTGTYVLPRGTIETSGILRSRLFYTHAITGGTAYYDNARGTLTVTAKSIKPRRELLIFRFTG